MDEQRPAPRVTVHDPSRPARPLDLLGNGDDEPPRPNPLTPKRLRVLAGALAVVALAAGAVELRERRAAAAEERRLARVVDLSVEGRGGSTSYDPATSRVVVELQLRLVNDGPRDLAVEGGVSGSFLVVQQLAEVPAGSFAMLTLRKEVACSPTEPPPLDPLRTLDLALRTAAGPREVSLPLQVGEDGAARACGFLELEQAVDALVASSFLRDDVLRLDLELVSRSVREVRLEEVAPPPGLRVRTPSALPLVLPPRPEEGGRALSAPLEVVVTDCRAAQTARPELALRLADENGRVSQVLISYESAFLASLVAASCSG